MLLGADDATVELTVADVEPPIPPYTAGGDVTVAVRVRCHGFAAAAHGYVVRDAWAEFLGALAALERTRRGEAVLASADERVRLRFFVTDRAGHTAVEGRAGEHRSGELRLEFPAIAFDPSLLPRLLRELTIASRRGPASDAP